MTKPPVIRVPASSANLGAGFDVLGMALDLSLDVGLGAPPDDAVALDEHHPATKAFTAMGGTGTSLWIRSSIPMGRGLGFSGAARVGGAALAVAVKAAGGAAAIADATAEILGVTASLEGHGDNVAASLLGGVVAWVDGRAIPVRVGPNLTSATVVAWLPESSTSTDQSRASLASELSRSDVVANLGRLAQLVLAIEHDDPDLLAGATDDRIHQSVRLATIPGAAEALAAGVGAGAWCGWLSGSGPTVAWLCAETATAQVVAALPSTGHTKTMRIAPLGAHVADD